MSQFELDRETYIIYPAFALGTAASLGIVGTDILPFINLGDTFITTGGIEWTGGRLLSLLALASVFINRDDGFSLDGFGALEMWAVYVTIGLIVAPPFFPALEETLAGGAASFISFTVQSIGFALISWLN